MRYRLKPIKSSSTGLLRIAEGRGELQLKSPPEAARPFGAKSVVGAPGQCRMQGGGNPKGVKGNGCCSVGLQHRHNSPTSADRRLLAMGEDVG